MWKLVGVGLGMAGSILTGLHDVEDDKEEENDGRLWGDVLGLLSAVGYGAYAVMIRVLLPHDESLVNMQLFLGFVGLWNCILLAPVAIFQLSSLVSLSWIVFGFVVLKGLLDNVLSDYLWARAVVVMDPGATIHPCIGFLERRGGGSPQQFACHRIRFGCGFRSRRRLSFYFVLYESQWWGPRLASPLVITADFGSVGSK